MQHQRLIFNSGKWIGFPCMFTFLCKNARVDLVNSKNEEIKTHQHILKKHDPKLKIATKMKNFWLRKNFE